MNKIVEQLPELKLVGITIRTSNVLEMDPHTAKIGITMQRFFMENLQDRISNRKNRGRVFAVYTNYENNEHGLYTYFLGEEVTSFGTIMTELETLVVPMQTYIKFTSTAGKMPKVVIDMWQNIWKMTAADLLDSSRAYVADFEIYDERSRNSNNAIVDIYLGINKYI